MDPYFTIILIQAFALAIVILLLRYERRQKQAAKELLHRVLQLDRTIHGGRDASSADPVG